MHTRYRPCFSLLTGLGLLTLVCVNYGAEKAPRIAFEKTTHDFGEIKRGETVKYSFIFTNTGNDTLEVLDVKPGCGCTTAGEWQKQIPPGQTGSVPLQFNSTGFSGRVGKGVTVTFKDELQPTVMLTLSGKIWTPVEIEPSSAIFTHYAESTNSELRSIRILNNVAGTDLMLETPQVANPRFRAEVKTNKAGQEYTLEVTMVPPFATGVISAPITLKTSSKEMPLLSVTAMAIQRPSVVVSPERIMIPTSTPLTGPVKTAVTIHSLAGAPVVLTDPTCTYSSVQLEIKELQSGRLHQFFATFPSGFKLEPGKPAEMTVKTSHPSYPTLRIPILEVPPAQPAPAAATLQLPRMAPGGTGPLATPVRSQ